MARTTSTPERSAAGSGPYRFIVVAVLCLIYVLNSIDRQILPIMAEPIRKDLGLSDTELGMLTGLTFAFFYATCAIPIGWLADRVSRVRIIVISCAAWSLCTAACGFANSFATLALVRVGVAVGEAGGSPPSYSLLSDYFKPHQRGLAFGLFSLGGPLGSMAGAFLGGWVATAYGWRLAFIVVGLPGVVIALAAWLIIREPRRGATDLVVPAQGTISTVGLLDGIASFFADRTLRWTAAASASSAFVAFSMLNWHPAFMMRVKGMSLSDMAVYYSAVLGVTGISGTLSAGWLVDVLGRRDRRWYAWVPALGYCLSVPFYIMFLLAPTWPIALRFLVVPAFTNNMYLAPAIAIVQNRVAPERRTVSNAIIFFSLGIVGSSLGPLVVGAISDLAKPAYGVNSLTVGLTGVVGAIIVAIGVQLMNARSLGADARREAPAHQ